MSDTEAMHQRLSKLIWDAQGDQDHRLASQKFADAEQLAQEILLLNPRDGNACYAIALTWYHRWLPSAERRQCLEWLRRTEQIDPQHPWVPLYLGYQLFDDGKFQEAHAEFSRVDRQFFESIEHDWRNLKTDELILVCQIRGDFASPEYASFSKLVADYIAAEPEDRALPMEIVSALVDPNLRARFSVDSQRVAEEACRLILGVGDQEAFVDELQKLQDASSSLG